ncbi:hypothetical protein H9Q69_001960 [Fusarium xylarioides]|nr:hypothetical protein H9Q69_001960 [Fusarium xylarioides]
MSPTIRFSSSYTPMVLPRLSIFQQRDEEGLDSAPESEQVEGKTELGLGSREEGSDEDDDPDEGFPVNLPGNGGDELDFITFANDDDNYSGDDTKNDHIDNDAVLKKVCGQLARP